MRDPAVNVEIVRDADRTTATTILVRATGVDERLLRFADALADASGHAVVLVTDERRGPTPACGRPVAGIADAGCDRLGLYRHPKYAWQCGDYAYYVARERYPTVSHFWLVEYDVRFTGDVPAFFAAFDSRPEIDFLAAGLRPAGWDWFWAITARGRDVRPIRCLFPVTRLSARAIDALRTKRVAQGRRRLRRFLWPNDEAFVATTLVHGDFVCHDLNDLGAIRYDDATFTFTAPIDGDAFADPGGPARIHHPVLYGEQFRRKLVRLRDADAPRPFARRVLARIAANLNSRVAW